MRLGHFRICIFSTFKFINYSGRKDPFKDHLTPKSNMSFRSGLDADNFKAGNRVGQLDKIIIVSIDFEKWSISVHLPTHFTLMWLKLEFESLRNRNEGLRRNL